MTEKLDENNENTVVDMLLSRNVEETVDSESMILETQKRVWGALWLWKCLLKKLP